MFVKFSYLIQMHAISSQQFQILLRMALVACVMLAHAASRMKFYDCFEFTSSKQYSTSFFMS